MTHVCVSDLGRYSLKLMASHLCQINDISINVNVDLTRDNKLPWNWNKISQSVWQFCWYVDRKITLTIHVSISFQRAMLESESSSDARVSSGGYSAAVQGASHQLRRQNEALVRLPRDASYKLVFTNAYDSVCAVNVEIDGIQVGKRC